MSLHLYSLLIQDLIGKFLFRQETTVIEEEPSAKDWQSSYHNSFHKEFDSQDDSLFQDEVCDKVLKKK